VAKPITEKTHIGERRENRPNGDIYICVQITAYDKKPEWPIRSASQKLKGKWIQHKVVPTRPQKNTKKYRPSSKRNWSTGLRNALSHSTFVKWIPN